MKISDFLSMGAVQTSQVLNSNAISEWLTEENSNGKKSHLKIPTELYAIQTLTKLQYCSVTTETTMLLL